MVCVCVRSRIWINFTLFAWHNLCVCLLVNNEGIETVGINRIRKLKCIFPRVNEWMIWSMCATKCRRFHASIKYILGRKRENRNLNYFTLAINQWLSLTHHSRNWKKIWLNKSERMNFPCVFVTVRREKKENDIKKEYIKQRIC